MSVSQTAPSPFAALLRRSKFASYDPLINQVYTTHGGHAHRGNWGLKRPLPNRRRVGFITVRSVDSPEQQTEWNSAESSARWLRRWEEIGKKLELEDFSNWTRKGHTWSVDTEFDTAGRVGRREREEHLSDADNLLPNPEAMSPKQFKNYLKRLRALRPEFKAFLETRWREQQAEAHKAKTEKSREYRKLPSETPVATFLKRDGSGEIDMFGSAQNASFLLVEQFLTAQAIKDLNSLESRRVEPRPQYFAGLEYTFMSSLQSEYLHKPVPGRDVAQSRALRYEKSMQRDKTDIIAVGGILGELGDCGAQTIMPTDFGTQEAPRQNREQGKGTFLMHKVKLFHVPSTVGHVPQKAGDAEFRKVVFRTPQAKQANISNPYPLGSLDYVGLHDGKGKGMLIPGHYERVIEKAKDYRRMTSPKTNVNNRALLDTLGEMANRKKSS